MHAIKINRALRLAGIGSCHGSAMAMLDYVPASVRAALSGAELGELLDALWRACQDAKALAAREAIGEGAIWDARRQRLREIGA